MLTCVAGAHQDHFPNEDVVGLRSTVLHDVE